MKSKNWGALMRILLPLIGLLLLMTGCSEPVKPASSDAQQALFNAMSAKLQADQNDRDAELRKELDGLSIRLRALELEGSEDFSGWATLDPAGGKSYQVAETNVSPVLVSFTSATPKADGSDVQLQVGNLSTARFGGAELTLRYNKRMPQDPELRSGWANARRETTAKIQENLTPGTWNSITVSLPGIKPDELGFLSVKVKLDTVYMYQPPPQ